MADLSHEVRSPLNAIIGFTELLNDEVFGPLNEQQREVVDDVLAAGRHLLHLVDDVLDISKIDAGMMDLQFEVLAVATVVEEPLALVRSLAIEKDIRLAADVPRELAVWADERRVCQILCNLLTNAIRYSPRASQVSVSAHEEGGFVLVRVADHGYGIAPPDLERIFDEFVAVDCGGQRGGTGLGLSVSRRLAHLMGGDIRVESAVGRGSAFTLSLPRRDPPIAAS